MVSYFGRMANKMETIGIIGIIQGLRVQGLKFGVKGPLRHGSVSLGFRV